MLYHGEAPSPVGTVETVQQEEQTIQSVETVPVEVGRWESRIYLLVGWRQQPPGGIQVECISRPTEEGGSETSAPTETTIET